MNLGGSLAPFDFVCLVLASGALIDAWRNGSLFASRRDTVALKARLFHEHGGKRHVVSAALDCAFCLGYHVPWVLGALTLLPAALLPETALLFKAPLYTLAATRAAWLLNGLLPAALRYDALVPASDGDAGHKTYRVDDRDDETVNTDPEGSSEVSRAFAAASEEIDNAFGMMRRAIGLLARRRAVR